jgi:hypothetical protein
MKKGSILALLTGVSLIAVMSLAGCAKSADTTSAAPATSTAAQAATSDILEIVNISDAHPGDDVTVTVKTAPGAEVKIVFTMPTGKDSAYPEDNTKTAEDDGIITWTWNINSHVPAGEATYTFTVTIDGQTRTFTETKTI